MNSVPFYFLGSVALLSFFNSRTSTPSQRIFLIAAINLFFYFLMSPRFVLPLIALQLATFWMVKTDLCRGRTFWSAVITIAGAFLCYKVFMRARETSQSWFVPIGFSYVFLQNLTFLIDARSMPNLQRYTLVEFLAGSTFFANIVSGPITAIDSIIDQIKKCSVNRADLELGTIRFVHGLFKKCVLEFFSFPFATWASLQASTLYLFTFTLLRVFVDFSAYTDMALGAAQILGIKLPENFNRPYASRNMLEFWSRWHMSLTDWCRTYLYFPIVRYLQKFSKHVALIQFIAVSAVFFFVGIWHDVKKVMMVWACLNIVLLVVSMLISNWAEKHLSRWLHGLLIIPNLFFVFLGQIVFTSAGVRDVSNRLRSFFSSFAEPTSTDLSLLLFFGVLLFLVHNFDRPWKIGSNWVRYAVLAIQLFLVVVLHNPGAGFIYADF